MCPPFSSPSTLLCEEDLLELTPLMCSQLLHDFSTPLNALTLGMDFLEEDPQGDMRDLLKKTLQGAVSRLALLKEIWGQSSKGSQKSLESAAQALNRWIQVTDQKVTVEWEYSLETSLMPEERRWLLILVMLGIQSLVHGGSLRVHQNQLEIRGLIVQWPFPFLNPQDSIFPSDPGISLQGSPNVSSSSSALGRYLFALCQHLNRRIYLHSSHSSGRDGESADFFSLRWEPYSFSEIRKLSPFSFDETG